MSYKALSVPTNLINFGVIITESPALAVDHLAAVLRSLASSTGKIPTDASSQTRAAAAQLLSSPASSRGLPYCATLRLGDPSFRAL